MFGIGRGGMRSLESTKLARPRCHRERIEIIRARVDPRAVTLRGGRQTGSAVQGPAAGEHEYRAIGGAH
jgi:hypothetical protein